VDEVERLADWVGFMSDGRLLFVEPVASLLARFRLVEVVASGEAPPALPSNPAWLPSGTAGRTLRFVDTAHNGAASEARLAAAFPGAAIEATPMPLREIFVALARARRTEAGR
jgi:ABC-2 type transport system ATP-binding protein